MRIPQSDKYRMCSLILNCDDLVKNRLGPYALVIKNSEGKYLSPGETWTDSEFYDYSYSNMGSDILLKDFEQYAKFSSVIKIYLMTKAGDIELKEKDLRPEIFKKAYR